MSYSVYKDLPGPFVTKEERKIKAKVRSTFKEQNELYKDLFDILGSQSTKREEQIIYGVRASFPDLHIYKNFKVGSYHVVLYIEEHNLVVDYDSRQEGYDTCREEFIKSQLHCEFIHIPPRSSTEFSIFSIISAVHKHIMQKIVTKNECSLYEKDHKIELLRQQIEN